MSIKYHRNLEDGLTGKYAKVACRLPESCSVLELGCSSGYFSRALMSRGHHVLGIEADTQAVRQARALGVSVICGDLEDPSTLSSINTKFDVVLLMDVLEHLREPGKLLNRVYDVLKENGLLLITGPNIAYWHARLNLFFGRWSYQDTGIFDRTHLRFYNLEGWKELIHVSGYRVTQWESAVGMIPLESQMKRLMGAPNKFKHFRDKIIHLYPQLFTIVYLFEASPMKK